MQALSGKFTLFLPHLHVNSKRVESFHFQFSIFCECSAAMQIARWPELVDETLCFGWIDGGRKRIDDNTVRSGLRLASRPPFGASWTLPRWISCATRATCNLWGKLPLRYILRRNPAYMHMSRATYRSWMFPIVNDLRATRRLGLTSKPHHLDIARPSCIGLQRRSGRRHVERLEQLVQACAAGKRLT